MSAAHTINTAGRFATCRRGGLTNEEIREIEAHRARLRPTPWQALAKRYARPEAELRAMFEPAANDDAIATVEPPDPPQFVWTREAIGKLKAAYIDLDLSAAETARILGCTREAVIGKAARLGMKKRRAAA